MDGDLTYNAKWSVREKSEISKYLKSVKKPKEINRVIRGLDEMAHWKATEFRTFLLYCGIVILKKYLPPNFYNHFLCYFCAITIFSSEFHLKDLFDAADQSMKQFLNHFKTCYHSHYIQSNVHNLCHLADDVKLFGPLHTFSTYPFESKLFAIKRLLRSGNLPLSQIGRRMIEQEIGCKINWEKKTSNVILKKQIDIKNEDFDGKFPAKKYKIFLEAIFPDFVLKCSDGNDWMLTKNLEIIKVKNIVAYEDNSVYAYGSYISDLDNFFNVPFPSCALHIYKCNDKLRSPKLFELNTIRCKMFMLRYAGDVNDNDEDEEENETSPKLIFIPLLHSLK